MKQIILIIIFLMALKTTYAQETPPPGLKSLPTASRFINPADSSIWTYKGTVLGWHREGKYADVVSLLNGKYTFMDIKYYGSGNYLINGYSPFLVSDYSDSGRIKPAGGFAIQNNKIEFTRPAVAYTLFDFAGQQPYFGNGFYTAIDSTHNFSTYRDLDSLNILTTLPLSYSIPNRQLGYTGYLPFGFLSSKIKKQIDNVTARVDTGFIKNQYQEVQKASFNVQFGKSAGGFEIGGNGTTQRAGINPGGVFIENSSAMTVVNAGEINAQLLDGNGELLNKFSIITQPEANYIGSNRKILFTSKAPVQVYAKPLDSLDIVRLIDLRNAITAVDTDYIKNQYIAEQNASFNVKSGTAKHLTAGDISINSSDQRWSSQYNAGNINIYKPEGNLYLSNGILSTGTQSSNGNVFYTLLADTVNQVFRVISDSPIVLDAPKVKIASEPTEANDAVRLQDLQAYLNYFFNQKIDSTKNADNVFTGANKFKNLIIPVDGGNGVTVSFQNQNNTNSQLYYNGGSTENNGYLAWNGDYFQTKKLYVTAPNAEIGLGDNPNNGVRLKAQGVVGSHTQILQAADGIIALVGQAGQDPSVSNNYIAKSGGTMTGDLKLASPIPTDPLSAAPKVYVDNLITGITWKNAVRVKTTSNIILSGLQIIDGVSLASGNRVLVNNQTNTSQNGIYVVSSSIWARPTDSDESSEITNSTVAVTSGTANKNTQWTYIGSNDPMIGTDAISYGQISGAGTYNASGGINLSANVFSLDQAFARGLLSGAGSVTYNTTTGQFSAPTVVSAFTNDAGYQTSIAADAKYLPLAGGLVSGLTTFQSNSEQLRLAYASDPSKYTSFSVNAAGSINLSSIGSVTLTASGANATAFNNNGAESGRFDANGRFGIGTGTTVSAKLHVVSTAEQIRAGYDTNNFTSLTTTASGQSNFTSSLGSAGIYNFSGTVNVSGGITQSGVNYNLVVPNSFQPSSVGAIYNMGGSTVQYIRTGFYGNSGLNMQSGSSYSNVEIASSPITTSSSGTHPIVASLYVKAPSITATSGSTISNTATVAIEGAPSAATAITNYAFLVNSGLSQFNGNVGITAAATLFANVHSNSTSSNNALMTLSNNGTVFSRNVNDANAAVTINQQQGTGNLTNWQYGATNIAFINTAGRFSGEGLGNTLTGANALIQPTSNGTVVTRNIADANAALSVNQANASSTGNVQEWLFNGSKVGAMTYLGNLFLNSIQNNGGASLSQVTVGNTGTTINRNINDANIALIVNQQQGTGAINAWRYAGSNVAFLNSSGTMFMNSGIANLSGVNNSYVNTSAVGTIISKNLNDVNPSLVINNNQGTGNIANFQFGGLNRSSINLSGEYENIVSGNGIILKSPDGTRYRIAVANGGSIQATAL